MTTTRRDVWPDGRERDGAMPSGGFGVPTHTRPRRLTGSGRLTGSDRPDRPRRTGGQVLSVLAAVAAAAVALSAGLALAAGDRRGVVLPLALAAGIAVGVLAMTRFSGYVILMLAVRPLLDVVKLSGPTAGRADTEQASRLTDPSTMVAVLFLLAAGLWLAAQLRREGRLRGSPLGWAMLLVGATAMVSALGADRPTPSLLEALRILTVVVMFVVLEQLMPDRAAIRRILLACYASLALALAYTVLTSLFGQVPSEVKGQFIRVSGPFSQSTTFGRYLMFLVIFGFAVYRFLSRRARLVLGVLLATSLIFLMLTNTRSAILGAAIGLVVVAVLHRSGRMLVTLLVVAVAGASLLPSVADRFAQLGQDRSVGGGPTGNTLQWRVGYWTDIVPLANRNPVTGIGPNMTQHATPQAKKPHNDLLRAYVETGVAGLLAYLAMLVLLVHTGRTALRRAPPGTLERGVAVGFAGCAVAFIAVSLASNVISNVVTLWYFVAFAAAASAIAHGRAATTGTVAVPASPVRYE
ncbi:O-antigen ligase family protein [Solwaraspora sp. WMMD406]|uniref:O-antigen ligase family protein n=1 Tax=Solwaraspora sp. WMMD406 TaxID=3016095 RepID=UPI0024164CBB|nr:O-antigen ligase family protein [Solwaraspora sp. WMMD406]MDG4764905.1 O-antigen ligase family protein [Solwaraspora sp. WMMD406]